MPAFYFDGVGEAAFRNAAGQGCHFPEIRWIEVDGLLADLESPVHMNMAGQTQKDGIIIAVIAQSR